ncbi:MAG: hypothetical protein NVSMB6_28170 [Burkholderiaceae bacterium]
MLTFLRLSATLAALLLFMSARADVHEPSLPFISYVNFQSLDPANPLTVSGRLRVPTEPAGKMPAVVVVHGSAGVDSRGQFYVEALNSAGIATLEIDMWAARGWLGGVTGRPRGVPETLPDAFGALKFLAAQPRIDAQRIAILGFSWGGVVSMLSATQPYAALHTGGMLKFAAHVANYPVCWVYNRVPGYAFNSFTGSPVLIQAGALDSYDVDPSTCPNLVHSLLPSAQTFITAKVYSNAAHAFDRLAPPMTVTDPFSHQGRGGQVAFVPNPRAAHKARLTTVQFFEKAFHLPVTRRVDIDED